MDPSYYHELNSWAIQNNTMIIYPLKVNDELLFENNNSIAYQTKEEILIARLGRECAKSKMKTILIKSEENENLERIFANEFNNNLNSGDFNLITTNLSNYKNFKKPTDTVNYVLLSDNEEKVEKFMMENSVVDKINKKYRSTKEDIKVYGKESWTNFVNITQVIENNYSFNYTSDEDFNYLDEKVKELHYRFRNEFQCDLSKYACLGYDMTFNVLSYLLLDYSKFEGNMTAVMFEKQFPFTGFQNTHSYFLKFDNFVSTRY